jgi:hypothetical protein
MGSRSRVMERVGRFCPLLSVAMLNGYVPSGMEKYSRRGLFTSRPSSQLGSALRATKLTR